MSDLLEQGWQAEIEPTGEQPWLKLSRTMRHHRNHYLDRKFINTAEARQLDVVPPGRSRCLPNAPGRNPGQTMIKGPSELAAQVTALGRKGPDCPL